MKIACLSDIHVDFNSDYAVIDGIKRILEENNCKDIIIAGDMTGDYTNTERALNYLYSKLNNANIYFVLGNHDYWNKNKSLLDTHKYFRDNGLSINNNFIHGDQGDFVVVGNSGWYDYSFRPAGTTLDRAKAMKIDGYTWVDKKYINLNGLDNDQVARELEFDLVDQIEKSKSQYKNINIIAVSHIVPNTRFVNYTGDRIYDYNTTFFGNTSIGKIYDKYEVAYGIFGHTHTSYDMYLGETKYICAPLGYAGYEWKDNNAYDAIKRTMKFIEV